MAKTKLQLAKEIHLIDKMIGEAILYTDIVTNAELYHKNRLIEIHRNMKQLAITNKINLKTLKILYGKI